MRQKLKRLLAVLLAFCLTAGVMSPAASAYTHDSQFDEGYTVYKGIDVSHHQGDIDWAKVKKAGVKFAFIRCGYTSLSKFSQNTDREFKDNIKNAIKNGIKVGVYYFSQAKSTGEARKEAKYVLDLVKGYQLSLPIAFDEESENSSYRFQWKDYSKSQCTNFALAFCEEIEAAGYDACVYNSVSTFSGSGAKYDPDKILNKGYQLWVARYSKTANDSKYRVDGYTYWQYSSTGSVSGISGNVDLDFWYRKDSDIEECVEVEDDTSVTSLSLAQETVSLAPGETAALSASAKPSGNKDVLVWSSSDDSVAYVDDAGTVTGVQAGTATITVASSDGEVSASCQVKVAGDGPDEVYTVTYGDKSFNLGAKIGLENASYGLLSGSAVSVTEDGTVTIKGAGVADITAQAPAEPVTESGAEEEEKDAAEEPVPEDPVEEEPDVSTDPADQAPEGDSSAGGDESALPVEALAGEEDASQPAVAPQSVPEEAPVEEASSAEPELPEEQEEASQDSDGPVALDSAESRTIRIVVKRLSLETAEVELASSSLAYTGKEVVPEITSVTLDGVSVPAKGYQVYVNNNINRGRATAAVVGQGNYGGVATGVFYIRSSQKIYVPKTTYDRVLGSDAASLSAKNISQYGGKLTYKSSDTSIATVSSSGKVTPKKLGAVTITITAAKNSRYNKATKTVRVRVIPKKVTLSSVSAGKKKLTVKWKTTSGSGYQVQYSTSSSFSNASKKTVSGKKSSSKTITGLKSKKKYYVRVRAYYKTDKGTTYGAWSSKKSVKTK